MLKKFSQQDISTQSKVPTASLRSSALMRQVKSSVQRGIRAKLISQFPCLEGDLADQLLPKKEDLILVKCRDNLSMVSVRDRILFFQFFDGPYYPHLMLLHEYPALLPTVQADKGAIKFVLSGANIMCPGLTSPGAVLDESLANETVVAIMAEGKEHAMAVGILKMSGSDIKKINKGNAIDNIHCLGDGLWKHAFEAK
ncbi:MAG: hypothetical protein SGCHY_005501 [Lobulomycetales sp.]